MFALVATIVWFLTAPFIGAFDDPANGLYVGLALFAAHFAFGTIVTMPWERRD